jgi:hypothetical protein
MYIALSMTELFQFAETVRQLTTSIRCQEDFRFLYLDDQTASALARVEEMVQRYIGEDDSGVVQEEVSYYNGE